jgi:purine-binding chemotaxis protein CheW
MATASEFDWERIRERLRATQAAVDHDVADDPDRRRAILEARSHLLAARRQRSEADADDLPLLEVMLDHERYAFAMGALAGIVDWRHLGPIPNGPAEMLGMLNARGNIWCIYSLKRLLGLPGDDDGPARIVLLRHPRLRVGLRVSATAAMLRLNSEALEEANDDQFSGEATFVRGMTRDGLVILDDVALLKHPAIKEVD